MLGVGPDPCRNAPTEYQIDLEGVTSSTLLGFIRTDDPADRLKNMKPEYYEVFADAVEEGFGYTDTATQDGEWRVEIPEWNSYPVYIGAIFELDPDTTAVVRQVW